MKLDGAKLDHKKNPCEKIPLLIDCDPGIDDAIALMVASASDLFEIRGLSSVSGNLNIDTTTKNIALFSKALGLKAVLSRGAEEPLVKGKFSAEEVHGRDGLGGASALFEEAPLTLSVKANAVETMRQLLLKEEKKTALIAIGPLTNIALLLKTYPEVKEKILVISIMGGSLGGGNVTPISEFNFYVDPEAASIVFSSGVPLILSGLHMTKGATLTEKNLEEILSKKGALSVQAATMLKNYPRTAHPLHDPCAVLALTHPEIFTYEDLAVRVDTREGITQGMSYIENRDFVEKKPNCRVLHKLDTERFREILVEALSL